MKNLEDGFTERKPEGVSTEDIRKTLVAFANSVPDGEQAILFIGVEDDGTPSGITNTDQKQKDIRRIAEQKCYPPITTFNSIVFDESGKSIIAVIVNASMNRPHFAGTAYVRVGSESIQAAPQVFDDLIASRNDKVRRILREKGKLVTVRKETQHTPGIPSDGSWWRRCNCQVESCDAHFVSLLNLNTNQMLHESVEQITIGFDKTENRLLLYVKAL
jgi:hypothetical protein